MESNRLSWHVDNEVELHGVEHLLVCRAHTFSCLLEIFLLEESLNGRMFREVKVMLTEATNTRDHLNICLTNSLGSTCHNEVEASINSTW